MVVFTLPEMKVFKRQMVDNMVQDIKIEMAQDQKNWETTKSVIDGFDTNLESLEQFQKSKDFRGSKSPRKICERIRFGFLAEGFLNTQLRLAIVDDLTEKDRTDLKKLAGNHFHEMLTLDDKRTRLLRQRFERLTMIKKIGDNEYKLCQTYFEACIRSTITKTSTWEDVQVSFSLFLNYYKIKVDPRVMFKMKH